MKRKEIYSLWSKYLDYFYYTAHTNDVVFYRQYCKKIGGNVLEFGAGTGRISIPIADENIKITALDINKEMIEKLSQKIKGKTVEKNIITIQGDMKNIEINEKFSSVIIPARALLLAENEKEQIQILKNAKNHLKKNGKIIFDIYYPDDKMINSKTDDEFLFGIHHDLENSCRYIMTGKNNFDRNFQLNHSEQFIEKINSKGETEFKIMLPVKTRYLYHNQVMEICEKAEITIENYYGDFNFGEINKNSDDIIYVCKN